MTSKHKETAYGTATTTLLTRVLTLLEQKDMKYSELRKNCGSGYFYKLKDAINWLLIYKLIEKRDNGHNVKIYSRSLICQ